MEVTLISSEGKKLPLVDHEGKVYAIAPTEGTYTINLHNNSPRRRLAVISVDGVNIITGDEASKDGQGYVVGPWQKVEIPGWKRGDGKAAEFTFTLTEESYSSQVGKGVANVGVIGVATFEEAYELKTYSLPWWRPWERPWGTIGTSDTYTFSTAAAQDLGTGYGHETDFATVTFTFNRKDIPESVQQIRYASKEVLRSWGVPVDKVSPPQALEPDPFPADNGVPAPPGWRRD